MDTSKAKSGETKKSGDNHGGGKRTTSSHREGNDHLHGWKHSSLYNSTLHSSDVELLVGCLHTGFKWYDTFMWLILHCPV